jgi:5'-deoxynucleotidase
MSYSFFAMMARMKYIDRWVLMRNANQENISEHSLEVAMIAHALAIIGNEKCGKSYSPEKTALIGLYHDATEIITGDMPTPVKYHDDNIREAYKKVELAASHSLLEMLPDYMRKYYDELIFHSDKDKEHEKLVKAADKLSAFIKCMEEKRAGNNEFNSAYQSIKKILLELKMDEVQIFIDTFLEAYDKTLDELK